MLACILFVFGALVEYAAILFRKQKVEKKEVKCHCYISNQIIANKQFRLTEIAFYWKNTFIVAP